MDFKLLDDDALDALLGKKSPSQRHRNARALKMPKPIKVGGRNAYIESEIRAYIRAEVAKRDDPSVAEDLAQHIKDSIRAGENPWSTERIEAWLGKRRSSVGVGEAPKQARKTVGAKGAAGKA